MRATTCLLVSLLLVTSTVWAETFHVSPDGTGDGSRESPTDLQSALDLAAVNGERDTLRLQEGTYPAPPGGFAYGFAGNDGDDISIRGGYHADFSDRSEDPADTRLDGGGSERVLDVRSDISGIGGEFALEGLTIQNGYVRDGVGAGMRAWRENGGILRLEIHTCVFRDNEAAGAGEGGGLGTNCWMFSTDVDYTGNRARLGGAIYLIRAAGDDPSVSRILSGGTFSGNRLSAGPDAKGSAVYSDASPRLDGCRFVGETGGASSGLGSPLHLADGGTADIHGCRFTGITVDGSGSAIRFESSGGSVTNCLFANNTAGGSGALTVRFDAGATQVPLTVTNSTFSGNRSVGSGFGGAIDTANHATAVVNSIFWDNGTRPIHRSEAGRTPTISYSLVEGGLADTGFADGGGNILDPAVSPFRGSDDYVLATDSVCVDAGDDDAAEAPQYDCDGNGRPYDGDGDGTATLDMGAFELSPDLVTDPRLVVTFGEVELGKSDTARLVLSNEGALPLLVRSVTIDGPHAAEFALTEPFVPNRTVPPGGSISLEIEFTPADLGGRSAALFVDSDDPDLRWSHALSGEGIPFILLEPTTGTIGTELSCFGGPFGTKKGKAWFEYTDGNGRVRKKPLKILEWTDAEVRAQVTARVRSSGEYRVVLQSRLPGDVRFQQGDFSVRRPGWAAVDHEEGEPGDVIRVTAFFAGDRKAKPRLYFVYDDEKGRTRRKRLKIVKDGLVWSSEWGMNRIRFRVPKLRSVTGHLLVKNRVGATVTDWDTFTIR